MNKREFLAAAAGLAAAGLLLAAGGPGLAQTAAPEMRVVSIDDEDLATIYGTEQFLVHSERAGEDYLIQVAAPYLGEPVPSEHRFPVIYVTDGGALFPVAQQVKYGLGGMSQPAYVVGIGYAEDMQGIPPGVPPNQWRFRDLLHSPDMPPFPGLPPEPEEAQPPGPLGGGAAFEAFLLDELRPMIENRYPVDSDRAVLAGGSLGGLFVAMVLSHDPGAFAGYIIGSPALWIEQPEIGERIAAVAPRANGAKVFLGVGALEGPIVTWTDELEAALRGPDSAFDVRRRTYEDQGHETIPYFVIPDGVRHILPGPLPRGLFADLPSGETDEPQREPCAGCEEEE